MQWHKRKHKCTKDDLIDALANLTEVVSEVIHCHVNNGMIFPQFTIGRKTMTHTMPPFTSFDSDKWVKIKGKVFKKNAAGEVEEVTGVPIKMVSDSDTVPLQDDPDGDPNTKVATTPGPTGTANITMTAPGCDTTVQPISFLEAVHNQIVPEFEVIDDPTDEN